MAQPDSQSQAADVVVSAQRPKARLEGSADAVEVVEIPDARASDLGTTLNRAKGVNIRRSGGLGTPAEINLGGLSGDQVRVFFDGLPIEVSGLSSGLANIPPGLLERVEIYKGVVPIRFGADALGGALNLVPNRRYYQTSTHAAYQPGSFGTHRAFARHNQRFGSGARGGFLAVTGFVDHTANDYPIDVEIAQPNGRLVPTTVDRFHDDFTALGGMVEGGVLGQSWADTFSVRLFVNQTHKAFQHNVLMTVPYGEVEAHRRTFGATARYALWNIGCTDCALTWVASYARRSTDFIDDAAWVYDWRGARIRERRFPGEILGRPLDLTMIDHTVFGRARWIWPIARRHALEVSISPTWTDRDGTDNTVSEGRDPLAAERSTLRLVSGVEYTLTAESQLEVLVFGKHYAYRTDAEEPLPDNGVLDRSTSSQTFGGGGALAWAPVPELRTKLSYEHATRLPAADEIYGDGALVQAALGLRPEVSHNFNLSVIGRIKRTRVGRLRASATGFLRETDRLITLIGSPQTVVYANVYSARSLGLEGALGWAAPRRWLTIDVNATWQDVRNTSTRGALADFAGDRIPNQPYLFGNVAAQFRHASVFRDRDALTLGWDMRYVRGFFRTWESLGRRDLKDTIGSQWLHAAHLSYAVVTGDTAWAITVEAENLTDAAAFDYFGVQRPGRAGYLRLSLNR